MSLQSDEESGEDALEQFEDNQSDDEEEYQYGWNLQRLHQATTTTTTTTTGHVEQINGVQTHDTKLTQKHHPTNTRGTPNFQVALSLTRGPMMNHIRLVINSKCVSNY